MTASRRKITRVSEAAIWSAAFVLALLFAACGRDDARSTTGAGADGEPLLAVAQLEPTQGNQTRGTVRFIAQEDGVRVIVELEGLTPGDHGFHIHEHGDCSAPDATSAGGHFNPTNHPHAAREADLRHIGDLGNLTAGEDGRAEAEFVDRHLALTGENSIVGRSVVVHAGRDDERSQPSGDSGARVACGVVELQ